MPGSHRAGADAQMTVLGICGVRPSAPSGEFPWHDGRVGLVDGGVGELEGIAPGSLVVVRDEEWVVTQVSQTRDGVLVTAQGLGELVAGTTA